LTKSDLPLDLRSGPDEQTTGITGVVNESEAHSPLRSASAGSAQSSRDEPWPPGPFNPSLRAVSNHNIPAAGRAHPARTLQQRFMETGLFDDREAIYIIRDWQSSVGPSRHNGRPRWRRLLGPRAAAGSFAGLSKQAREAPAWCSASGLKRTTQCRTRDSKRALWRERSHQHKRGEDGMASDKRLRTQPGPPRSSCWRWPSGREVFASEQKLPSFVLTERLLLAFPPNSASWWLQHTTTTK
jgi:hypothetical protein